MARMNQPKLHLYEVGASEKKLDKSWWSNISYNVLTDSIQRALELFYEEHPDADVHRVEKRDRVNDVKYDPRLMSEPSVE